MSDDGEQGVPRGRPVLLVRHLVGRSVGVSTVTLLPFLIVVAPGLWTLSFCGEYAFTADAGTQRAHRPAHITWSFQYAVVYRGGRGAIDRSGEPGANKGRTFCLLPVDSDQHADTVYGYVTGADLLHSSQARLGHIGRCTKIWAGFWCGSSGAMQCCPGKRAPAVVNPMPTVLSMSCWSLP